MALLDRTLQYKILDKLLNVFPNQYDFYQDDVFSQDEQKLLANMYYLQQHQLISPKTVIVTNMLGGYAHLQLNVTEITHKGIDFMLDDGGLSAILNTVTVKLEEQQFRALLEQKIQQSNFSDEQKIRFIDSIKQLPSEGVKHLFIKLIDLGISAFPTLLNQVNS